MIAHQGKRLSELEAGSIRYAFYRIRQWLFHGFDFRFREGVPRGNGILSRPLWPPLFHISGGTENGARRAGDEKAVITTAL